MTGTFAARSRKVLIVFIALVGCGALFLFAATAVKAEPMVASYYGEKFAGKSTASGEPFNPYDYTAAHKTYAFGTKLIVTYEGRSVVVRINDRGPYVAGRNLDLSQGAAEYLGLTAVGVDTVDVEVTTADTPTGPYGGTREVVRQQQAPTTQPEEPVQYTQQAKQKPAADADQAGSAQPEGQQQESQQQEKAQQDFVGTGEDQYASANQSDQYKDEVVVQEAVPPAPPAPKPAVPVLPPEPEPAALEAPPVELAVPNSTIERRVELNVAAPPAPAPVEQPAGTTAAEETAKPVAEEVVKPIAQEAPKPVVQEAAVPEPAVKEGPEPVVQEDPAPVVEEKPHVEEKPQSEKTESKKPEASGPGGITVLPDTGGAPLGAIGLLGGALLLGAGLMIRITRR